MNTIDETKQQFLKHFNESYRPWIYDWSESDIDELEEWIAQALDTMADAVIWYFLEGLDKPHKAREEFIRKEHLRLRLKSKPTTEERSE